MKTKHHISKERLRTIFFRGTLIVALAIIVLIILYPLYLSVIVSFDESILFKIPNPPPLVPKSFSNIFYEIVIVNTSFIRLYLNTFSLTFCVLVLRLLVCFSAAYALSKGKFKLKNTCFVLILLTMMIPFIAFLLPLYLLFDSMNLLNTWMPIIIMSVVSPLSVFLLKQYLDELPDSLREAAICDGAREFRVCWGVYLPLCGPVIATVAILTIVSEWNNYLWPYLVLNDTKLYNVAVGLAAFSFDRAVVIGPRTAAAVLGALPMIVMYLFFQKYIVQSIASSGIKE